MESSTAAASDTSNGSIENKKADAARERPSLNTKTCRICLKKFDSDQRSEGSLCIFHPESFCGETAQRWLPPGETAGSSVLHYFYSCCGGSQTSPGCCSGIHKSWDDPDDDISTWGRRPGMGVKE